MPTRRAYRHEVVHLSAEFVVYGIGPALVVLAWLLIWAVLRRIPVWFFTLALTASLLAVLSPYFNRRSGPIADGSELDGLAVFVNGATAAFTCVVLLVVTGVLHLALKARRPTHPASKESSEPVDRRSNVPGQYSQGTSCGSLPVVAAWPDAKSQ